MTEKIHWFTGKDDCESFFAKIAHNCEEDLTEDFVFEGNNDISFDWIIRCAKIIGWTNIGVTEKDYNDATLDYEDEIFLNVTCTKPEIYDDSDRIFIDADETSIEFNGKDTFIRVWWD